MKKNTSTKILTPAPGMCITVGRRMKVTLAVILFASGFTGMQAQRMSTNGTSKSPLQIDAYIKSSASADSAKKQEISRMESLTKDLHSAIYYLTSGIKSYGDKPVVFFTDATSLNRLSASEVSKLDVSAVEMVTIKVNRASDVTATIEAQAFSTFPNLKYVYVLSTTPSTPANITSMLRNIGPEYTVVYNIATAL